MKNNIIELNVINNNVNVIRVGSVDYISLTDLAKYKDKNRTDYIIQNWMRNANSILFLGTWEFLNNINFNSIEFDGFKNDSGTNAFVMTPKKWIKSTNAIGIISKQDRYNTGTFSHPDIAFEFASWLSPEFKLYLIREFERLKKNELHRQKIEWKANRLLSKINYIVHTDAIKETIIPTLTEKQKMFVYAEKLIYNNIDITNSESIQRPKLLRNLIFDLKELRNIVSENINKDVEETTRIRRETLEEKPITKILNKNNK